MWLVQIKAPMGTVKGRNSFQHELVQWVTGREMISPVWMTNERGMKFSFKHAMTYQKVAHKPRRRESNIVRVLK